MSWFISELFFSIFLLFFSFVFHELGHIYKAEKLGYKVSTKWDKLNFVVQYYPNVSLVDDIKILEAGIAAGFIVALFSVIGSLFWSPLVLICYAIGCKYDLARLRVLYRNKRKI